MRTAKLGAIAMAALLVLTALAPAAVAAQSSDDVVVTTDAATNVDEESATLNGNVTELDGNATVSFTYWVDGDEANETTTATLEATSAGTFSIDVDDLEENTTYVYVANAETDNVSAVGDEETFTTEEETELEVDTDDATDVANTSATLNGELETLSGLENATVEFTYWVEGDEANNTTTASQTLDEAGAFTASVDDLEENTTYYYQATAASGDLTAEGDLESFTTGVENATENETTEVTTNGPTNTTNTSAVLTAELAGLPENETANTSFTYWVEGDENNTTTVVGNPETLEEDGNFSAEITGLENNTTYVYVATADVNSTYSSSETTFTTGVENGDEVEYDTFGQEVSAFVHDLLDERGDDKGGIGQKVSEFVTQNNPGADKRPDHAGKPDHAGPKDKGDKQGGPPADKGPEWKDDDDENEDGDSTEAADTEGEEDDDDDHPGNGNGKKK